MSPDAFQVEYFETASQIPDGLWDACFQPPAEGRWWYEALDESGIEDQFTFLYALIKHFGCPVGIAPVFFMDVPVDQVAPQEFLWLLRLVGKIMPSVLSQRTLFVGSPILDESRVGLISDVNRRDALLSLQVALEMKANELRAPLIVGRTFRRARQPILTGSRVSAGSFALLVSQTRSSNFPQSGKRNTSRP
jgi:hypothetical protein